MAEVGDRAARAALMRGALHEAGYGDLADLVLPSASYDWLRRTYPPTLGEVQAAARAITLADSAFRHDGPRDSPEGWHRLILKVWDRWRADGAR